MMAHLSDEEKIKGVITCSAGESVPQDKGRDPS
jgi:hypothetical protein